MIKRKAEKDPRPDFDRLEKLTKAATPGPWRTSGNPCDIKDVVYVDQGYEVADCFHEPDMERAEANAAYLAALDPQTVSWLIEWARRAFDAEDEVLRWNANVRAIASIGKRDTAPQICRMLKRLIHDLK